MKKLPLAFLFILNLIFALIMHSTHGQGTKKNPIMLDNEFERSEVGQVENIYCNPILLDGKPLNHNTFSLESKGELSLVSGDPNVTTPVRIPFYLQIRRNGYIVQSFELYFLNQELYEIEISKVLLYARQGDHLIINPTRQQDWKAKRVIKLIDSDC